jgi:benzoyl-CoA reductase/2-hydroxyglutaryl-CoA dehydratase subunit BcrC/BadD/HgdB
MKTVLYSCSFVPGEWIAAYGLRPLRAVPPSCGEGPHEGLCPYVRGLAHLAAATHPDAVILTTVCDQMRRAEELLAAETDAPIFLLHVPAAWRSAVAKEYYREELKRLGRFLCDLGGAYSGPAELANIMRRHEMRRAADVREQEGVSNHRAKRLALVGGELLREDCVIFDLVRRAGGQVVLDATDQGHRGLPARFCSERLADDPLAAVVEAYFGAIPSAFRRPNDMLYDYLAGVLPARGVRGVVFRRYPWCDTWNAELPRLRDATRLPVLDLDSRCDGGDTNRLAGRIEAFLEALS